MRRRAFVGVIGLLACLPPAPAWAQTQLANPASQNCVKQGGTLKIERRPDGGLRVTGYVTPAGRYCAITGGRYTVVTESAAGETGVCSLPGGKACDAAAYYAGTCSR